MENREPQTREKFNQLLSDEELGQLQLTTLQYYLHESNPVNGLIRDKTDPKAPSSIAAVGLSLAAIPVLVERRVVSREFAPDLVLKRLRFFRDSPQGREPDANAYLRCLLRRRHRGGGRGAPACRGALLPCRLAVGDERWSCNLSRVATGDRLYSILLDRLRRGAASVPARTRLTDLSTASRELRCLLLDVQLEENLRPRSAPLWAAIHTSALAPLD